MLGEWGDDACLFSVYPTRVVAPRGHKLGCRHSGYSYGVGQCWAHNK